jgi:hypothetical protein
MFSEGRRGSVKGVQKYDEQWEAFNERPGTFTTDPVTKKVKADPSPREMMLFLVRSGSYPDTAAAAQGVFDKTWRRWLALAARDVAPFNEFIAEVRRAEAHALSSLEATTAGKHGREDGQLGFKVLGARQPRRWAPTVRVQIEQTQEMMLDVAKGVMDEDTYARFISALDARLTDQAGEEGTAEHHREAGEDGAPEH